MPKFFELHFSVKPGVETVHKVRSFATDEERDEFIALQRSKDNEFEITAYVDPEHSQ